jgi:hypothetical protein
VEQLTFYLEPEPRPAREKASFLFDQRPDLSQLYRTARSDGARVHTIAIRLLDLIVHDTRAFFGRQFGGDVRLDTAVVTGPIRRRPSEAYQLKTQRFQGIRDDQSLPLEHLLIFHGPVASFVDIAVWVSRDQRNSPTLGDLFQKELNSEQFKIAATTLASLTVTAPQAALVVGALGAGATMIDISARLLNAALGKSIGLFRTTFLAQEQFGVGRHPAYGTVRWQDFSLGYEIVAVD